MTQSEGPRPKLHDFLTGLGLDHYGGAALIGCSGEYVRRLCLPYDSPRRCQPSLQMRQRIARATGGAVGEGDWTPPAPRQPDLPSEMAL